MDWIKNTEEKPCCYVGDQFLVAIPLAKGGYEFSVITAEEGDWEIDGNSWGWSWDDVEYYIPINALKNSMLSQKLATLEGRL